LWHDARLLARGMQTACKPLANRLRELRPCLHWHLE
jgi:hypothetical protein